MEPKDNISSYHVGGDPSFFPSQPNSTNYDPNPTSIKDFPHQSTCEISMNGMFFQDQLRKFDSSTQPSLKLLDYKIIDIMVKSFSKSQKTWIIRSTDTNYHKEKIMLKFTQILMGNWWCDYECMVMKHIPENDYLVRPIAYQFISNKFVKGYLLSMEEGICSATDLLALRFSSKRYYTEAELVWIMTELCKAFSLLHSNGIAHCDIKPSNIFLFKNKEGYYFKIGDFGISLLMDNSNKLSRDDLKGWTKGFDAPEISKNEKESTLNPFLADIYALGVTFLCFIGLKQKNLKLRNTFESKVKKKFPLLFEIAQLMMRPKPSERISLNGIQEKLANLIKTRPDEEQFEKLYDANSKKTFMDSDLKDHPGCNFYETTERFYEIGFLSRDHKSFIDDVNSLISNGMGLLLKKKYGKASEHFETALNMYESENQRKQDVFNILSFMMLYSLRMSKNLERFREILSTNFINLLPSEIDKYYLFSYAPPDIFKKIKAEVLEKKEDLLRNNLIRFHHAAAFFEEFWDPNRIAPSLINQIYCEQTLCIESDDMTRQKFYYRKPLKFMDYCLDPSNLILEIGTDLYFYRLINEASENYDSEEMNLSEFTEILDKLEDENEAIKNKEFLQGHVFMLLGKFHEQIEPSDQKVEAFYNKAYNMMVHYLETTTMEALGAYYKQNIHSIEKNLRFLLEKSNYYSKKKIEFEKILIMINDLPTFKLFYALLPPVMKFYEVILELIKKFPSTKIVFQEVIFSFQSISQFYKKKGHKKKGLRIDAKEIELKKKILGNFN